MQKTNQTATVERNTETSRFNKRIGSVIYQVNVHFNPNARETMNDKILRLFKNEAIHKKVAV
jgi:hypothetical protein